MGYYKGSIRVLYKVGALVLRIVFFFFFFLGGGGPYYNYSIIYPQTLLIIKAPILGRSRLQGSY